MACAWLHAGGVDGMPGGEVVAAVEHHVSLRHQRCPAGRRQRAAAAAVTCTSGFRAPMACLAATSALGWPTRALRVGDLALQVGQVDRIMVDHREVADPGWPRYRASRRTQPSCADHQSPALPERAAWPSMPISSQQDVARVAQQFGRPVMDGLESFLLALPCARSASC